ncbi:hypothetical protein [Dactylosporangium sp. NPDC051484]|uniref:hypothetical protein n=1 Tax=Dactylosporangium sp. NPDC051484 TaxID=3154942 RepID=UPI00344CEA46
MAHDHARFGSLLHAYGRADDTPGHLAALAGGDPQARDAALGHLWSAVMHQGTPWTVTPPAAAAVAALLADPRPAAPLDAGLRSNLLSFLAAVAESAQPGFDAAELAAMAHPPGRDVDAALAAGEADDEEIWADEELANALYARALLGCREVVPTLLAAAVPLLGDPDATVRAAAAHAVTACATALGPGADPGPLGARLSTAASTAGPDERAALVLAMGELGLAPREYLDDPHPGVRACAALAPALADDPAATAELLAALDDPKATEHWFARRPPQLRGHIRFALVAAAVDRVERPERLLPAALAIAAHAGPHTARSDWGPLLHAIFAPGSVPGTGGALSAAQRHYLHALVANDNLWDPRNGSVGLVFRDAGLPHDREACRAMATAAAPPDPGPR